MKVYISGMLLPLSKKIFLQTTNVSNEYFMIMFPSPSPIPCCWIECLVGCVAVLHTRTIITVANMVCSDITQQYLQGSHNCGHLFSLYIIYIYDLYPDLDISNLERIYFP